MSARLLGSLGARALMVGAGVLQAQALAWPCSGQAHGWVQLLALALLAGSLARLARSGAGTEGQACREAVLRSGLYAASALAATFWWLHISMHEVGGMPAPLSLLAVALLALALALYHALAGAVWLALVRRAGWTDRPLQASVLFAALWLLAELLRGRLFSGFPWGAVGYAHIDSALSAAAPWVGVYGIGALAAGLAMRLAWPQARLRAALWSLGLALLLWVLPSTDRLTQATGTLKVELLQANIAQDQKFDPARGVQDALQWYGQRLLSSRADLVVAPETALPLLPGQLPAGYLAGLQAALQAQDRLALVGLPWADADGGYRNSALALGLASADGYRYDKHHLVPFGEYVPWGFAWFVRWMNIPLGDFTAGAPTQPPLQWRGQRLAPNICYEDLFGEELARALADPQTAATVLINVSNIAWFGDTVAVDQHLNISRMRALELGRPMLRATNTGATAFIDHQGQVQSLLPRFTRGSLEGQVQGRSGLTPYARWVSAWGLAPLWAAGLAVLLWALARARRRQR